MISLKLEVNGRAVTTEVAPSTLLIDLLRGPLALTGTHQGCDTAQCGACTVLVNGESVKSCSLLAVQAQGAKVTTVEGLAQGDKLHPLQQAFIDHDALQCGYCTPGMVMALKGALDAGVPARRELLAQAISGNVCRCGAYDPILRAALDVASSGG